MSNVSPLLQHGLHSSGSAGGASSNSLGHQLASNSNSLFLNNLANSQRASSGDVQQSSANGHHTLNSLNSLNNLSALNSLNSNLNSSLENSQAQFNIEAASNADSSTNLSNHMTASNTVPTSYFPFPTTGDQASVYTAAASSLAGTGNSQQCANWDAALKQSTADYNNANSSYLLNNKLSFQQISSNGSSYAGAAAFNSNGAISSAANSASNSTYFCLDSAAAAAASTFPLSSVTNGSSATHLNNLNNLNQLNLNSNSTPHLENLSAVGNPLFNPMMHHHHSNHHQSHSSLNSSLQSNLHSGGLQNAGVSFDYFTGLNMNSNLNQTGASAGLQTNGSSAEQTANSLESTNGSNNLQSLADQKGRIEHE